MKKCFYFVILVFFSIYMVGCSNNANKSQRTDKKTNNRKEAQVNLGKVAYIQKGNLWVRGLPDGSARQLTTDGIASGPRWSQSGKWVLFQKKDQLWVTDTDGSNCRLVADNVNAFTWSSTDDIFYYATESKGFVSVRPETKEPVVLIKPSPGKIYGRMVNSPDGRYIVFERSYKKTETVEMLDGLWKLDITTKKVLPIFKALPPDQNLLGVVPHLAGWSSNGKTIYLWVGPQSASLTADGVAFTAIDADTGKNLLADNLEIASLTHKNWFVPSPDPKLAALITGCGRETWTSKQLALINLQTKKLKVISGKGQAVASLAFSPSGETLAFSAGPEEKEMYNHDTEDYSSKSRKVMLQRHIWAANIGDGPLNQLTKDIGYRDEYPVWSIKGDYILFGRIDNRDKASLWLMDADGSNPIQIVAELSPFDWFGFYGYVDWEHVFDYWRG